MGNRECSSSFAWRARPALVCRRRLSSNCANRSSAGACAPGFQLPPSRELARQHNVSRNTVIHAYERLISEGYLAAIKGVRTIVAETIPETCLLIGEAETATVSAREDTAGADCLQGRETCAGTRSPQTPSLSWTFGRGVRIGRSFRSRHGANWPTKLSGLANELTNYGDPAGLPALRAAIARHVAPRVACVFRRIRDRHRRHAGSSQHHRPHAGDEGDRRCGRRPVLCEPGIHVSQLWRAAASRPRRSRRTDNRSLPERGVSFAYVTPSHQFPTGATLRRRGGARSSLGRSQRRLYRRGRLRQRLYLRWAAERSRSPARMAEDAARASSMSEPFPNRSAPACGPVISSSRHSSSPSPARSRRWAPTAIPGSNKPFWRLSQQRQLSAPFAHPPQSQFGDAQLPDIAAANRLWPARNLGAQQRYACDVASAGLDARTGRFQGTARRTGRAYSYARVPAAPIAPRGFIATAPFCWVMPRCGSAKLSTPSTPWLAWSAMSCKPRATRNPARGIAGMGGKRAQRRGPE